VAATFTTKDGELIYLLNLTSVEEQEDGSLGVSARGATTHLTKKDAHDFKLATSSPYRTQQQPSDAATVLDMKLASLRRSEPQRSSQQAKPEEEEKQPEPRASFASSQPKRSSQQKK
jgi:hypothetical protein